VRVDVPKLVPTEQAVADRDIRTAREVEHVPRPGCLNETAVGDRDVSCPMEAERTDRPSLSVVAGERESFDADIVHAGAIAERGAGLTSERRIRAIRGETLHDLRA